MFRDRVKNRTDVAASSSIGSQIPVTSHTFVESLYLVIFLSCYTGAVIPAKLLQSLQLKITLVIKNSVIVLFNKPFNVLCQFTDQEGRQVLKDFIDIPNVYAAGRLDRDSEGLLVLTDDGQLQKQIADPKYKMAKTYWVQVDGDITQSAINQLAKGVELKDGKTRPAQVKRIHAPVLWDRDPPVRFRKHIPTSWIALTIKEGKNRQVRRMTAAVGFPTLRLVRYQIGQWRLDDLQPGEYKVV